MHRLILKFRRKVKTHSLTSLFSYPFCPFATLAAVDHPELPSNDAASTILTRLINSNYRDKRGVARRFRYDPEFKTLISGLCSPEIDGILEKLRIEYPETALDLFFLLKNDYGVKHSRDSYLFIAHVLAKKERLRALKLHLLQMVQQEEFL
ncbi:hypothetical protein ACH5RR_036002 [Cinchona calisaya]|uniref:Uncharacterized protein n=1 Tax=Cinchona calisaya TaxID=153742 RepID=A0ABD2Y247_9GENT